MIANPRQMPAAGHLEAFLAGAAGYATQIPAALDGKRHRLELVPGTEPGKNTHNTLDLHLGGHQVMLIRRLGQREITPVRGKVPVFSGLSNAP